MIEDPYRMVVMSPTNEQDPDGSALEELCYQTTAFEQSTDSDGNQLPYRTRGITRTLLQHRYNPLYPEDNKCECGHAYYRHFDGYENELPVGCKYCNCYTFKLKKE